MAKKATTTAKRSYKLDLMGTLEAADRGLKDYYDNLTEEERKGFAPVVLIRWLSTLSDNNSSQAYALIATNDLVNLGLFQLQKNHPELVWKLMCVAGTGKKQYHQWIPNKKHSSKTPLLDQFIQELYPLANQDEQQILRSQVSADRWLQMAQDSGYSDKQMRDLRNEFKKQQQEPGD